MRRPVYGGLLEVVVEDRKEDGSSVETIGLPAAFVDAAPAPLRRALRALPRAPNRKIPEGELAAAGLIAGLCAEFAKILILHPVDTVRTRLQSRRLLESRAFSAFDADGSGAVSVAEMEAALRAARPEIPAATVRALVEEADEDGSGEIEKGEFSRLLKRQLRGDGDGAFLDAVAEIVPSEQTRERAASSLRRDLYAGVAPALLTAAPQAGVYAATREVARRELGALVAASQIQSDAAALLAVVAASSVYWVVRAPSEVYKLQKQARAVTDDGDGDDSDGDGGVFGGASLGDVARLGACAYPTCVAAELPPLVARVFCYKALSSALRALGGGALLEEGGVLPIADEVAAAVAVACAVAALATPLDVLRTRTLQILLADNEERIQDGAPSEAAAADPTGIKRAAAELAEAARRDGTAVLFAGTAPRVLWNGCVVGATTPLRSVGFGWVRDGVILQLFDSAAGAARIG